jgi:putative DNA primase/helicase
MSSIAKSRTKAKTVTIQHYDVLQKILDNLNAIDLLAAAENISGNKFKADAIPRQYLAVLTVSHVLETAKKLNLSLAKRNAFTYLYNGEYWKPIEEGELKRFLGDAARKLGIRSGTFKFYAFQEMLLEQFLTQAYLSPKPEDDNVVLINLRNGTYEINTGTQTTIKREFREEDFLTYQLPFEYDANAACPMWQAFLDEVLPDQTLQDIIAEYMGYCFTHNLKLERVLLLYGDGANGKSVVFDVMSAVFGDANISNYGLMELTSGNDGTYNRAKLVNKLLNFSSELSGKYASDLFKKLASNEPVSARLPYGQPFIASRYAKLAFNANELPIVSDKSHGYFRRLLIIPFEKTIAEENQDTDLAKKIIAAELPGVFNWVLNGLKRILRQRKFTQSEEIKKTIKQYKHDSNSVALFADEKCWIKSANSQETLTTLYREYKEYCLENGYFALGRNKFARELDKLGYQRHTSRNPQFYMTQDSECLREAGIRIPASHNENKEYVH